MPVTRDDVEKLDAKGWQQLPDDKKDALLSIAKSQENILYGGQAATLDEVEGDRANFTKFLAAHLWELAEGGEASSEGSQGGSVSFNTVTGDPMSSLTETRFGRMALQYLRQSQSIGFVVS